MRKSLADFYSFEIIQEKRHKIFLIYANNKFKQIWDAYITVILLFIAIATPYRVAFNSDEGSTSTIYSRLYNAFDISFLIDIFLSFFTTYIEKTTNKEITDHKAIAFTYIKSWFFIDLISIFPFEYLVSTINVN